MKLRGKGRAKKVTDHVEHNGGEKRLGGQKKAYRPGSDKRSLRKGGGSCQGKGKGGFQERISGRPSCI